MSSIGSFSISIVFLLLDFVLSGFIQLFVVCGITIILFFSFDFGEDLCKELLPFALFDVAFLRSIFRLCVFLIIFLIL